MPHIAAQRMLQNQSQPFDDMVSPARGWLARTIFSVERKVRHAWFGDDTMTVYRATTPKELEELKKTGILRSSQGLHSGSDEPAHPLHEGFWGRWFPWGRRSKGIGDADLDNPRFNNSPWCPVTDSLCVVNKYCALSLVKPEEHRVVKMTVPRYKLHEAWDGFDAEFMLHGGEKPIEWSQPSVDELRKDVYPSAPGPCFLNENGQADRPNPLPVQHPYALPSPVGRPGKWTHWPPSEEELRNSPDGR